MQGNVPFDLADFRPQILQGTLDLCFLGGYSGWPQALQSIAFSFLQSERSALVDMSVVQPVIAEQIVGVHS